MYYEEFRESEFAAFFGTHEIERIEEVDGFIRACRERQDNLY